MRAVIYARYSSDRQTEQSIEGQLRECQEFAQREGITIVNHYIDRAISGKTDNRPAFQKMISDSSSHEFEYVLVYKLDRFARNRYDSAIYKAKLKKNGVKVLSAKENIMDSPEGIILEGLLEAMNEYYSAELSQKIKRGMRENRIKGKVTGGNVALGFKVNSEKYLEIDEKGAELVKIIFTMYCEGSNFAEICRYLNEKGHKTSRGSIFRNSTLSRIIPNRHYIGEMGDEGIKNCPAIIDEELFFKANARLVQASSHRKTKSARADYILTSKLYCGRCGKRMTGRTGTGKSKNMYYYYTCGTTGDEWLKKKEIEDIALKSTAKYLTASKIKEIAEKACKLYNASISAENETDGLEKELKNIEKSIANIISAIEQGIFSSSTKNRLEELEKQKEEIELEITGRKIKAPALKPEHFEMVLKKFADIRTDDEKLCKSMIETLIDKIIVYPDKIAVTLNVANNSAELETINQAIAECSHIVSFGGGDAYSDLITYLQHFKMGKPHRIGLCGTFILNQFNFGMVNNWFN